jgi:predicted transcriptional regulator
MLFVGLDLHNNYSEFAIMYNDGRLIKHGRVENSLEDMNRFSNSLPPSTNIVVKSSSTWYWSYKLLSSRYLCPILSRIKQ